MNMHNMATGSLHSRAILEVRIFKIDICQRLGADKEAFYSPLIILCCPTPIPAKAKYKLHKGFISEVHIQIGPNSLLQQNEKE